MSSHPEYAYAVPSHPFHEFVSPPATAVDLDAITLDEFSRRRAARARLLNPEFTEEFLPELPIGWRKGVPRKHKNARVMRVENGVTLYRCCKCHVYLPAYGYYNRKRDFFGIQSRCKGCSKWVPVKERGKHEPR